MRLNIRLRYVAWGSMFWSDGIFHAVSEVPNSGEGEGEDEGTFEAGPFESWIMGGVPWVWL